MLTKKRIGRFFVYLTLACLGILLGYYMGARGLETAQAADILAAPEATNSQFVCEPANVAVFTNRIHIKCSTIASGGIQYFALSTTDSRHTARVLSLLLTAKASGQRVGIDYNFNDTSGVTIGCYSTDCRLIRWVWIVN